MVMADLGPVSVPSISVRIIGDTRILPTCTVVGESALDVQAGADGVTWALRFANENVVGVQLYGWTFTPSVGGVLTDVTDPGIVGVSAGGTSDVDIVGALSTNPTFDSEGVAAVALEVVVHARTV
jgi:hypothetical protein